MSISISCPECQFRFHVGDEFAGKPGRCPECDAVIQVPRSSSAFDDNDDGFGTEDYIPKSRRTYQQDDAEAFDDAVTSSTSRKPFDPAPRILRWRRVAGGFRNLAIASVLMGFDLVGRTTMNIVNGLPNDEANMTSAQKAMVVGNAVITAIAICLWALGRMGLTHTPFNPASGTAKGSGYLALTTAIPGIIGSLIVGIAFLFIGDNPIAAMGFIQLAGCGLFIFMIGWLVAEFIGLSSQISMMKGIKENGAASWGRIHMIALTLMIVLSFVGCCGIFAWAITVVKEAEELKQKQIKQGDRMPDPPFGKDKQGANNPNQPPQIDFQEHKNTILILGIAVNMLILGYIATAMTSSITAMKAVNREIERLGGGKPDPDEEWHQRSSIRWE